MTLTKSSSKLHSDDTITLKIDTKFVLDKYYAPVTKPPKKSKKHGNSKPPPDKMYTIIDPKSQKVKYWMNMFDVCKKNTLPLSTDKACWWCRTSFESYPLGCPVNYIKDNTTTTSVIRNISQQIKNLNLNIDEHSDYFETIGVFCSFPCIKAYILDELSKSRTTSLGDSLVLLTYMYYILYGKIKKIPSAGSWKMLKEWGGSMSIEEYRSEFGKSLSNQTLNIKRPFMFCSSEFIREEIV